MHDVSRILAAVERGDFGAAESLFPLVYEELRQLAAVKLAAEKPGQTLQATALVHEAYLRLVDQDRAQHFENRRHFFGAAAEAMRRILVERARRRNSLKEGGGRERLPLQEADLAAPDIDHDLLALDAALDKLAKTDPGVFELVKLRYFAGLTIRDAAQLLGISSRTANHHWNYAKAWLLREIEGGRA